MLFEWDKAKNRNNFAKHGLDFSDAEHVLTEPCVTFPDERFDYGENRLISLGSLAGRVVVIAHAPRGDDTTRITLEHHNTPNVRKISGVAAAGIEDERRFRTLFGISRDYDVIATTLAKFESPLLFQRFRRCNPRGQSGEHRARLPRRTGLSYQGKATEQATQKDLQKTETYIFSINGRFRGLLAVRAGNRTLAYNLSRN
jgi:uncharacterized protein